MSLVKVIAVVIVCDICFSYYVPQALAVGGHDHDRGHDSLEERPALYRAVVALSAIFLFFNVERILGVITMKKNLSESIKKMVRPILYLSYRRIDF